MIKMAKSTHPVTSSKFGLFVVVALMMILSPQLGATTFYFAGYVDATDYGLSSSELATFVFSYDPATVGITGSPNNVTYPIDFTFTVGAFSIEGQYGGINIRTPPVYPYAQFALSAATYAILDGSHFGNFVGQINGIDVDSAGLNIIDSIPPLNMLNSNDLPSTTDFVLLADQIIIDFSTNDAQNRRIRGEFTPGTFTFIETPEPSSAILAAVGLLALCLQRRLR